MDFVAARGQFHSEFGGDDTRAAVCWIAGNSNLHVYASASLVLLLSAG